MTREITAHRENQREQTRIRDLFELLPARGARALDVGARDGYLSRLMADRFEEVVALDLERPRVEHPRVLAVRGDVTQLEYPDNSFDAVVCAEVLEHIPPNLLERACAEIVRVTAKVAVIGVPYRQDTRLGRTVCHACGKQNPPWGHLNTFDEARLVDLFPGMSLGSTSYVGQTRASTNALSAFLMDLAGNPYGTYEQEERCIHCAAALVRPTSRNLPQKVATKVAHLLNTAQQAVVSARGNWIHMRFEKQPACS